MNARLQIRGRWSVAVALTSALLASGCGDDDGGSSSELDSGSPALDASLDSMAPDAAADAGTTQPVTPKGKYLVPAVIEQGESGQTYLNVVDSLSSTTTLNPKHGKEVQGWNYPFAFEGSVFVADGSSPTLTKYSVSEDGSLVAGATISFAGVGVTDSPRSDLVYIVNREKAYFLDAVALRAIVWNPTTMTLTGKEFSFPTVARQGLNATVRADPYQAVARGTDLFLSVGWYDQDWKDRFVQALLIIDTSKDEVRGLIEDERCGDGFSAIQSAAGDIYVFPSAGGGLQFHVNASAPRPSCALRVRAGEYVFDPSFKLDLSALVGGVAVQGAIPDPARTGFLFASYDESLAVGDAKNFWKLHFYDFATGTVQAVQGDATPWSGAMRFYEFEGRVVAARWHWSKAFEATTLVELPGGPNVNKLFTFAAAGTSIVKVR